MTIRTREIEVYENNGALLTVGSSQVLSFTAFNTPTTGTLSFDDSAPRDLEWDFPESATFQGDPASLTATGTAFAGVNVTLLGINLVTVQLSTPAQVAVFGAGGAQYLRFFNADGSDADPAALLDALATQLVAALNATTIPFILQPLVNAIIANPLNFVEQNAVLTFNLSATAGMPVVTCFAAGTLIMTRNGEVAVDDLAVGAEVLTLDHGFQPIRWIGRRDLSLAEMVAKPNLRPIRIETGALGHGLPVRTLTVSPQHRCLVRSKIAQRMVGEREVLVAAKHLVGLPGITVIERPARISYFHMLFDRHELVFSQGAVTESFYLGPVAVSALDAPAREEILTLFPALGSDDRRGLPEPARAFMSGHLTRRLVERTVSNGRQVVEPREYLRV